MIQLGQHQFKKWDIIICIIGVILCLFLMDYKNKIKHPDMFDSQQYIGGAYNLYHHGVYNTKISKDTPAKAVSLQPAYSWALYPFFIFDKKWDEITPDCLEKGCDPAIYQGAVFLNFLFCALVGLALYLFTFYLTKSRIAAAIAGFHIWININLHKPFGQIVSDPLALFLVTLLTISTYFMIKKQSITLSLISGFLYALLILDRSIFLYSLPIFIIGIALYFIFNKQRGWQLKLLVFSCFCLTSITPVFSWVQRNHEISGEYVLADSSYPIITLGAREIFNDMTLKEYFVSYIYWIRGSGDSLSEKFISKEHWERFLIKNPNGFYIKGHSKGKEMIGSIMDEQNISYEQAQKLAFSSLKQQILTSPFKHVATSIPLLWRGIQIDVFVLLSIPALIFMFFVFLHFFREYFMFILTFFPSIFTIFFIPLISISIPRYFIPAMPILSFATALFIGLLVLHKTTNPLKIVSFLKNQ